MPESVVNALVNAGILGPVLLAVGWYVIRLHRELKEANAATAIAQEKRVEDAHRVAVQLLELNDKWAEVVAEQTAAQEELKRMIEGVRELLTAMYSGSRYPVRGPGGK